MKVKCSHNVVEFLAVLEEDDNTIRLLFLCKKCNRLFVHTKVKA